MHGRRKGLANLKVTFVLQTMEMVRSKVFYSYACASSPPPRHNVVSSTMNKTVSMQYQNHQPFYYLGCGLWVVLTHDFDL